MRSFAHFFIDRPIFAAVLSIVITIVGGLAFVSLPVAQYPDVAPPTVVVSAQYPGASPDVIASTVATPLEQEVNGVEGMMYMESQSANDGSMTLTITFELGTDLDVAQVLVQNRVAVAEPRLPEEVRRIGITTRKQSPDLLLVAHLTSPDETYDQLYISNYGLLRVRDVLARVEGVGDVRIFGAREYSIRVWLDADKLASLGMTAGQVVQALQSQNVQVAAGAIGRSPIGPENELLLPVNTLGRLTDPQQFADVIVRTGEGGRLVRVGDVARVELGAWDYSVNSYLNEDQAVAVVVFQQPGSNAVETAENVIKALESLSADFPPGLVHRLIYNPTQYIQDSIDEVFETLFIAAGLVALTVLIFLQSWRATIIPLAAIPVSLVGTFAAMQVLGFSLNNLSLFGLVLAIGTVVDDAIVVVENVERNIDDGLSPREATRRSMDEISGALIATTLVLIAVFVPTAFLSGISGQFYRQFALTIAVSVAISTFVSLTLSPALCALLLKRRDARPDPFDRLWNLLLGWFFRAFNWSLDRSTAAYVFLLKRVIRGAALALILYVGLMVATGYGFRSVPAGFIPAQDQGYLIVAAQLPDGASLSRTDEVTRRIVFLARDTKGVGGAVAFAGFSGATRVNSSNAAAVFVTLDPFPKRIGEGVEHDAILGELRGKMASIAGAQVFVIPPPPVRGLGTGGGFKMMVQDRSGLGFDALQGATTELAMAANQVPGLVQVFSTFRAATPQIFADIDRTKVRMLDVPLERVFEALQVFLGSVYVNDFNLLGRTYRVAAQADVDFRNEAEDIGRLRVLSASGAPVPLGSLVELEEITAPDRVIRYNLYPAADLSGDTLPGYSTGQSLQAMERLAAEVLPRGISYEWTDIAFQEQRQTDTALYIFPLCVLFVFLVLAAQYESLNLPLAIILIVPMCLLSGIAGVALRGMDNNLLTQIGFVVLMGLASKNAILIVEFAKAKQDEGLDRVSAALEASRLRLRPILMTSFSFVLGVIPLLVAKGAGAEMRQALGTVVFYGMLGVTFFGLFFTPVFYVVLRRLAEGRRAAAKPAEEPEPEAATVA
ncbi:efflux RND transporter permease subunit [Tautonia plasticadhaerens]|uniref:Efflux pump membrane transporter BepE n=1 Tax=Tautonia plasticadhaerens TaxID=2527974 RepID=A0A518H4F8_9BACT|nr:multidrug efflux RND transporter permease subunit [Tautonia plasticadhaerens]QDV35722.1 Efflux pump membrane transporter BepE [Tautonia plasticadhaerens]